MSSSWIVKAKTLVHLQLLFPDHQKGAEMEIEYLGYNPTPVQEAGFVADSITHYATDILELKTMRGRE